MLRTIGIAISFLSVAFVSHAAYSEDAQCPDRVWASVKQNLEFTANTPGPDNRGCAEVRVHGGETAYDAFKHCNPSLKNPGLRGFFGTPSDDYTHCGPQVCNWFKAQNPPWSPAC
jgi:hypothetical protein